MARKSPFGLWKIAALLCAVAGASWARGVSPYLPLNMSPAIERQIERVLILADRTVIRRPIAAAIVWDSLPKACAVDAELCREVEAYLSRYTRDAGVSSLKVEGAVVAGDSDRPLPNAHGMPVDSPWEISGSAFWQPGDHLLLNAGGIAYQGRARPTGTVLSAGFDIAQLDVGFRDHWLSPLTDSSMLIGTEAPTMPSITLSNYRSISPLGISYEVFLAQMSKQDDIAYLGSTTSGKPRIAGLQAAIQPVSGYSLAINRVMQYGGGARNGGGAKQFFDALFKNSNLPDTATAEEFGNQVASITSSLTFPGKVPLAVRFEYAGEDNAYAGSYRLGATAFSMGIDFPRLWRRFDLTLETSEWQPVWYIHHLYGDGLTSDGYVIGHWFGDQRRFGEAIGGNSQMLRLGWRSDSGNYLQATYRTMTNESKWMSGGAIPFPYERLQEFGVDYTTAWRGHTVGAQLFVGRDVFGDSFARLAASFDLARSRATGDSWSGADDSDAESKSNFFVDLGANRSRVNRILVVDIPDFYTSPAVGYHFGFGVRRAVSKRGDLGARMEFDRVDDHGLISLRMLDYRYRIGGKFALGGFFGVGRYNIGLPAYGYYWGGGVQYRDIFKNWDLGLDARHHEKLGRDKVLANDPPATPDRTRMFFDVNGAALYLSRRF